MKKKYFAIAIALGLLGGNIFPTLVNANEVQSKDYVKQCVSYVDSDIPLESIITSVNDDNSIQLKSLGSWLKTQKFCKIESRKSKETTLQKKYTINISDEESFDIGLVEKGDYIEYSDEIKEKVISVDYVNNTFKTDVKENN